uniref:INCENP_ARK-bind domain-containing protein n=1 Tax=Globodera pallida TaxID=36090 RepID=A0A183BPJ0_GLOPA
MLATRKVRSHTHTAFEVTPSPPLALTPNPQYRQQKVRIQLGADESPQKAKLDSQPLLLDSPLSSSAGAVSRAELGFLSWSSFRKKANDTENSDFALYDNELAHNFIAPYVSGYTTPGPVEREASKHKKSSGEKF